MWLACQSASCDPREPILQPRHQCARSRLFAGYGVFFVDWQRRLALAQSKQLAHQIDDRRDLRRLAGCTLQCGDGCMHDLVDDASAERFDSKFLLRRKRSQPAAYAIDLRLPDGLQMFLQRDNRRHHVERLQPSLKFVDLHLHDGFGAIRFHAPVGHMRGDHLLQVIDVVDKDAVQLVHLRIDVAWHRDIDEEHRTVAALAQEALAVFFAEDGVRRAGRADHNVGARNRLVELVKRNGFAVKFLRQRRSAIISAIGNVDVLGAVSQQVTRGKLAHLPRANQVNRLALQVAEDFLCQIDRNRRDRYRRRRHRRFIAHALGDREGSSQQRIQLRIDRSDRPRGGISFFDLPKDLRFAHHHRIQAGGHAKHMPHRIALVIFVKVFAVGCGIETVKLLEKSVEIGSPIRRTRQQLHPVAGGNDQSFFDPGIRRQLLHCLGQSCLRNGEPLAHLDRRRPMIHADEDEVHEAINLCTRLKLLAAHAPIATTKAIVARNAARRPRQPAVHRV